MEDLLPSDRLLPVLLEDGDHAFIEVDLEVLIRLHAVALLEGRHGRARVPLLAVDFVAPDVEIGVRKQRGHLAEEAIEEQIHGLVCGIERRVEDAPRPLDFERPLAGRQRRIRRENRSRVAGDIELRHHADASVRRVPHHVLDLFLGVIQAVRAELLQARVELALDTNALVL